MCSSDLQGAVNTGGAAIYALLVVLKLIIWASMSFWEAAHHMKTNNALVGDLIEDMDVKDRILTTVSATFFHMFSIPTTVTDTSVQLHVRKPSQPYVAFKSKRGQRAWILGWHSKEQFKAVTEDRGIPNMRLGAIFDLPLLITQVYLKLNAFGLDYDMLMAFVFSGLCFMYRVYNLTVLMQYRCSFKNSLKILTSRSLAQVEQDGEQSLKDYIINHRLLQQHFGIKMPSDVYAKAQELGFGAMSEVETMTWKDWLIELMAKAWGQLHQELTRFRP